MNNVGGISVPLSEAELKVLGWNVPSECPIKNELNGNQFVQRVGRVDLGSLAWELNQGSQSGVGRFSSNANSISNVKENSVAYCVKGYSYVRYATSDKSYWFDVSKNCIYIQDNDTKDATSFKSAMSGVYLYYELATPNTFNVEGSEIVESIGKVTNLLKPTLASTTQNGVTCTNNGDGTYTLNGTASDTSWFTVVKSAPLKMGTYKLVGCPSGGKTSSGWIFELTFIDNYGGGVDYGAGALLTFPENTNKDLYIGVYKGTVCNNLVFKPMLTTNLSATYSDFVPFTGTTGKLNSDVAEMRNNATIYIKDYSFTVSGSAGTIGTRCYQSSDDIPSGYRAIGVEIITISDSSTIIPLPFVLASANKLYLNAYRATTSAISDNIVGVRVTLAKVNNVISL